MKRESADNAAEQKAAANPVPAAPEPPENPDEVDPDTRGRLACFTLCCDCSFDGRITLWVLCSSFAIFRNPRSELGQDDEPVRLVVRPDGSVPEPVLSAVPVPAHVHPRQLTHQNRCELSVSLWFCPSFACFELQVPGIIAPMIDCFCDEFMGPGQATSIKVLSASFHLHRCSCWILADCQSHSARTR